MFQILNALFLTPGYQLILAACLIAGIVRGFSGFGTGMILIPVIAAVYSPQTAVGLVFFIDAIIALPVVMPELKRANWHSLSPLLAGFVLALPAGVLLLKFADPTALRWALAIVIFLSVAILWSGRKYNGPRAPKISFGVGTLAGLTGGACGLPGPPAIIYWMASTARAIIIRANTMVFLYFSDLAMGFGLFAAGLLTLDIFYKAMGTMAFYLAGLLIGRQMFGLASEQIYRNLAFGIILVAAVLSLPVFD